jgi:hypothetical protein
MDKFKEQRGEPPPIQYTFPVQNRLDPSTYYDVYLRNLNKEKNRIKIGKAIKLNLPIILIQNLKVAPVRTKAISKPKEYVPSKSAEIISDEEFIERYSHYTEGPKINYNPVYMNNRMGILASVSKMMENIPIEDTSDKSGQFQRMTHQEIIRRYINSYTPYRGLLLFHGLGSGKTCSSISLIEGLMNPKKVVIMTPASLQSNYRTQMKFCGEHLFRKQNHWVFERLRSNRESSKEYLQKKHSVLEVLQIPDSDLINKYIDEMNGIWMVQKTGEPNFDDLSVRDKEEIDDLLTLLIKEKYTYLNYNGLTQKTWRTKYKKDKGINPFDDSTIIVDEAHNFVSRIVNKINTKKSSISVELYEEIMSAENCRVILLTGTPFINYPYELGALFNLIHGYTYILELKLNTKKALSTDYFEELLLKEGVTDIVEYNETTNILRLIKNPYGFIKQKDGTVVYSEKNHMYYSDYVEDMINLLKTKKELFTVTDIKHSKVKHLPDTQKDFDDKFLSLNLTKSNAPGKMDAKLKMFQLRIIGMVSYLGDKTKLMPSFVESKDNGKIHLEELEMNDFQIKKYLEIRRSERQEEKTRKKDDEESSSSYRIFSRAACNFVFPDGLERPMPGEFIKMGKCDDSCTIMDKMNEAILDNASEEDLTTDVDGKFDTSDLDFIRKNKEGILRYKVALDSVLKTFEDSPEKYFETGLKNKLVSVNFPEYENRLETYSPKFKRMLENILNNEDCHLIYSNFRKLEGIGLFRLALLYHGFKELKIVNQRIVLHSMFEEQDYMEDKSSQRYFSLFTGTESVEEKEILLHLYNNRFDNLPAVTRDDLFQKFGYLGKEYIQNTGNKYGEIIKILMITASGAEGIDLKNTRFVHIMEPYWHHVRINQVIGRARRIGSHNDFKDEIPGDSFKRNVTVFMYLSIFGDNVLKTEQYPELKLMDHAETTDMRLYRMMVEKEKLSERFLEVLKVTSIDCALNYRKKCFIFPKDTPNQLYTTVEIKDAPSESLVKS